MISNSFTIEEECYSTIAADQERVFTLSFVDWNNETFLQTIKNTFKSDGIKNTLQP